MWEKIKEKIIKWVYIILASFILFSVLLQLIHISYKNICETEWIKSGNRMNKICEAIESILSKTPFKIASATGPFAPFFLIILLPYFLLIRKDPNENRFLKDFSLKRYTISLSFITWAFIWSYICIKNIFPNYEVDGWEALIILGPILGLPFLLFIFYLLALKYLKKDVTFKDVKDIIDPIIKSFESLIKIPINFIPPKIRFNFKYNTYTFGSIFIAVFITYIVPKFIFTSVDDDIKNIMIKAFLYPYIILAIITLVTVNADLFRAVWIKIKMMIASNKGGSNEEKFAPIVVADPIPVAQPLLVAQPVQEDDSDSEPHPVAGPVQAIIGGGKKRRTRSRKKTKHKVDKRPKKDAIEDTMLH